MHGVNWSLLYWAKALQGKQQQTFLVPKVFSGSERRVETISFSGSESIAETISFSGSESITETISFSGSESIAETICFYYSFSGSETIAETIISAVQKV